MLQRREPGLWSHLPIDIFGSVWWNIDRARPYCKLCSHECPSNMPRDCGRWFQNPRQWLIQAVPCSTVSGDPQRETPFLYRLSWVGWWPSKLERLWYNNLSENCWGALLSSCSQCWCARFGELTAITNIGETRRRARSRNSVGWKGPNYFCLRLKLGLIWAHHVEEMSTMAWRTNTAGYHLHTYGC